MDESPPPAVFNTEDEGDGVGGRGGDGAFLTFDLFLVAVPQNQLLARFVKSLVRF